MKFSLFIFLLAAIVFTVPALCQHEIPNAKNIITQYDGYTETDGKSIPPPQTRTVTEQEKSLLAQIEQIRRSENPDFNRIIQLQSQIDAISGQSVTLKAGYYPATVTQGGNKPPFMETDVIGNTRIFAGSIKGIATATETVGSTAGKIWAFYFSGTAGSPDTGRLVYSTNNGLSWSLWTTVTLGGTDKANWGDVDMEIIEPPTGDKYLHVVYGLRATNGTGRWFAGGLSNKITGTWAATAYAFAWPGDNASNRYYNIRITSDNAYWPTAAYLYIACSFDSTYSSTNHYNAQKFVRCTAPYTVTPTFTYLGPKIWWQLTGTIQRTLYTDIAYFRNNADSVIVVYSGIPDSTKLFFSKMDGAGNQATTGQGSIGGSEPTAPKHHARIASNSNTNGSVICYFNQVSGGYDALKYFRTTNFGDFSSIAGQSVIWSGSIGTGYPSIVGLRNTAVHRICIPIWNTSSDSILSVSVRTDGIFITTSGRMNSFALSTGYYAPEIGFRYVTGDSCFMLISQSGASAVWSAYGCTAPVTGIGNNSAPVSYSLSQNYPNPFNPFTKIYYSIPNKGNVKMTLFNVLGKEVALLVNEVKDAGTYIYEFNASSLPSGVYFYKLESGNFSDTKKMMLVK